MKNFAYKYFEINRAISFGLIARIWSALAGFVTMILISSQLSTIKQGWYPALAGLSAIKALKGNQIKSNEVLN